MSQPGSNDGPSPNLVDLVPWEARAFQGQRAGIVTRTLANIVDFAVMVGALVGCYATWSVVRFLSNPARFTFPAPPFLALLACGAGVLLVYFTTAWATTGRTYGDHLLGLRVVNFRGEPMRWAGAAVRAGFCVILPLGLYWAVVSPTNRSLQDTALRTSVLYDWAARRRTSPTANVIPRG